MKSNLKKAFVVTKINFLNIKEVYIIVIFLLIVGVYNIIAGFVGLSDKNYVDMANYLYMLAILAPLFITARNFKKIIHLGGEKLQFYWGSLLNYVIIATCVSFLNLVLYTLEDTMLSSHLIIWNLVDIFGWYGHGMMVALIQQFAFIMLIEVFISTLTNMQAFWYGWLVDLLLVTIISVFVPTPMLRKLLIDFFYMIIFHSNVFLQIVSCFTLATGIYALNLLVLKRRKV